MKIYPDKLTAHLANKLMPIYLLSGDEPLLVSEAQSQLFQAASQQGFETRQICHLSSNQDWYQLANDYQSLSLFSEKEIIDIRLASAKFSEAAKTCLVEITQAINPDKLIIMSCPKIDSATTRTKWFKKLELETGFIQFWPIARAQFPGWLNGRLRQSGIMLTKTGLNTLATLTEGNLLAAMQTIQKLNLLYPKGTVSDQQLMEVISDHSQTDLYQLLDDILAADAKRIAHALKNLSGQGTEPILVLWLLSREIRAYLTLLNAKNSGKDLTNVFQSLQIWPKKQNAYRVIFSRHREDSLLPLLTMAYKIDLMIKGLERQNAWDTLLRLSLRLAGINI